MWLKVLDYLSFTLTPAEHIFLALQGLQPPRFSEVWNHTIWHAPLVLLLQENEDLLNFLKLLSKNYISSKCKNFKNRKVSKKSTILIKRKVCNEMRELKKLCRSDSWSNHCYNYHSSAKAWKWVFLKTDFALLHLITV